MKILYAVCEEGLGHSTRSKPIIEALQKKHNLLVVTGGRPYKYLSKFSNVKKIFSLNIFYINNSVSDFGTLILNLIRIPLYLFTLIKLIYIFITFRPSVLINDFEAFSNYVALLFGVPIISVDNENAINKAEIKFPKEYALGKIKTSLVVKLISLSAKHYFITSFFFPKLKTKKAEYAGPILRREILKLNPKNKGYVLVYQTSKTNLKLLNILTTINKKFVVYGFDKEKTVKNMEFRKFNGDLFLKDIENCEAVITNGGYTLITESLYLGKPVLSIPVHKQFEQILNAVYLQKLGYGRFIKTTNREEIVDFLKTSSKYKKNLQKFRRVDNAELLKKLEYYLKSLKE